MPEIVNMYLFVSSNCPHCPKAEHVAKEVVPDYEEDYNLFFHKIRTKSPEGKTLTERFGVKGVPTMIFTDNDGNELKRIVGVPSCDTLKSAIEKGLGIKKSFVSRFFGK